MIMIHSDNTGLVLPPKVAQIQIVIIPIKYANDDPTMLYDKVHEIGAQLREAGLRVKVDDSDTHNPGYKMNLYEVQGVPVRIELGARDYEKKEVRVCIRHSKAKMQMSWETLVEGMTETLEIIHREMYEKAEQARNDNLSTVDNWEDFMTALNQRKICLADWCDVEKCEDNIGEQSKAESEEAMRNEQGDEVLLTGKAKTLCIPFDQPEL